MEGGGSGESEAGPMSESSEVGCIMAQVFSCVQKCIG